MYEVYVQNVDTNVTTKLHRSSTTAINAFLKQLDSEVHTCFKYHFSGTLTLEILAYLSSLYHFTHFFVRLSGSQAPLFFTLGYLT